MNTKASILLLAAGLCATSTLQARRSRGHVPCLSSSMLRAHRRQPSGGTTMVRAMYLISTPNPTSLLYGETVLSLGGGLRTLGKVEGFDGTNNLYNASLGICVGRHAFFGGFRYLGGMKYTPIDQNENAKKKTRQLFDYTVDLGYAIRMGVFSAYAKGSYVYTDQGAAASTMVFGGGVFLRSSEEPSATGMNFILGAKVDNLGAKYKQSAKSSSTYAPPMRAPVVRSATASAESIVWPSAQA